MKKIIIDELKNLIEELDMLINFVDPNSQYYLPNDSILKNNRNRNILIKSKEVISNFVFNDKKGKKFLILSDSEIDKFQLSEKDITITEYVNSINNHFINKNNEIKKIRVTDMSNWLLSKDILMISENEKVPTKNGTEIGIIRGNTKSKNGKIFETNLFTKRAQEYIIRNFNDFITYIIEQEYNMFFSK